MKVKTLHIKGFRNLKNVTFSPCAGANIIYGNNAQGKTNLLEAVWLFSGAKSFRGSKDNELIGFDTDVASLELTFYAKQRTQTASLIYSSSKKQIHLNEIKLESIGKLAGEFCTVVFSPDHLSLVKQGPEKRRRFIDTSLCQAFPKYIRVLEGYSKALRQRNFLLRDVQAHPTLLDTLDIWDKSLLDYGAYISAMRGRYIEKLAIYAQGIYEGISSGNEKFSIAYSPSFEQNTSGFQRQDYYHAMQQALKKARADDIRLGTTSIGPHRDDLEIMLDNVSARSYGSQGQQRSCILALKLAECGILEERNQEPPVVLLDDVMSELDQSRRRYLLNHLEEKQVLITCCDTSSFEELQGGRVVRIENGNLFTET